MNNDIWIWLHFTEKTDTVDDSIFGLVGEARRLHGDMDGDGTITILAVGNGTLELVESLKNSGAHRILCLCHGAFNFYHGERFAKVVYPLMNQEKPLCLLMAHGEETQDLAARLGAMTTGAVATRVVDTFMDTNKNLGIHRPRSTDYLYEACRMNGTAPSLITLLTAALAPCLDTISLTPTLEMLPFDDSLESLETKIVESMEASAEDLAVEEADIVVAAGRGVGREKGFDLIRELARALDGSIGGTRPVVDWQMLPFERQIGQTGKQVIPRLIINCGISGANEYTAGMEKSQFTIAINTDARARIFKFADLGIVGDIHEILPLLIQRIQETNEQITP